MADGNFPIVLTADRSLMAGWPLLLDGMAAAAQTTAWPARMMWPLIAPRVAADGLRARQAPLGLRRIEAALLRGGFAGGDVAVVPPERIDEAVGPATRIVGLSSGDPLGVGMTSTTMAGIFGGQPVTSALFQKLALRVRRRVASVGGAARVVLGGPGAWQVARLCDPAATCHELGVDHVLRGYCETNAAELFRKLAAGDELPAVLEGQGDTAERLPPVAGATVMGMVELSRGCGWGCDFCTLATEPMRHLPAETILADVETNVAGGVRNLSLTSEDALRYGGDGGRPNVAALVDLLARIGGTRGVATMAIDHANVATLAACTDAELAEVRRLLAMGRADLPVWVNVGVETASGALLARSCGPAKLRPFASGDWAEACRRQVERLCDAGFVPMISLVIGLPGERADDVRATQQWVDSVAHRRVAIVPVLMAPVRGNGAGRLAASDLTRAQWELFRRSMRTTLRTMPSVYARHHAAAGVPWAMRALKQLFGFGYSLQWRVMLWLRKRSGRRGEV